MSTKGGGSGRTDVTLNYGKPKKELVEKKNQFFKN